MNVAHHCTGARACAVLRRGGGNLMRVPAGDKGRREGGVTGPSGAGRPPCRVKELGFDGGPGGWQVFGLDEHPTEGYERVLVLTTDTASPPSLPGITPGA